MTQVMKISVVIPAKDEEKSIEHTVSCLRQVLEEAGLDFEIVLVNDNSSDATPRIMERLASSDKRFVVVHRALPSGFGRAVRDGLLAASGDMVVIFMADLSDEPSDIIKYYRKMQEGYDCVFGSRFIRGSSVDGYPGYKFLINRLGNFFIQCLFLLKNNDITNAFKAYRGDVVKAVLPLMADHFNITVELPLKAVIRGFSYATVPINWHGRKAGISKHKLQELQNKYLFSVFYVFLEKIFLKDELRKADQGFGAKKPGDR